MTHNTKAAALSIISGAKRGKNSFHHMQKLQGAWIKDGKQYVADGFRALKLYKPIQSLPTAEGTDVEKFFNTDEHKYTVYLPTPEVLQGQGKSAVMLICEDPLKHYSTIRVYANAAYVLTMYKAFGQTITACAKDPLSPIVFYNSAIGEGIVMPVRNA